MTKRTRSEADMAEDLCFAAACGNVEKLAELVKRGAAPNSQNYDQVASPKNTRRFLPPMPPSMLTGSFFLLGATAVGPAACSSQR